MAIDGYMYFQDYQDKYLESESQIDISQSASDANFSAFKFDIAAKGKGTNGVSGLFEIEDFSFDVEQTLNIGSQSTGAGAGKITFNPFSITRKIDVSSPVLYESACSGTPFRSVVLGLRKGSGGTAAGKIFLVFVFKLVAVKTISWAYDDESPKETTTFEYGGLQIHYSKQSPGGDMAKALPGGWNRVKNVQDRDALTKLIQ